MKSERGKTANPPTATLGKKMRDVKANAKSSPILSEVRAKKEKTMGSSGFSSELQNHKKKGAGGRGAAVHGQYAFKKGFHGLTIREVAWVL